MPPRSPLDGLPPGASSPLDRRRFLTLLGVGALTAACGPGESAADTAVADTAGGAAGAAGAAQPGRAVGVQLYTVRGEMERDMPGTLERLARIGYREVEFAGYHGRSAADVRALLDQHGLRAPAAHVPLDRVERELDAVLAEANTAGHQYVIVPWLTPQQRAEAGVWDRVIRVLNDAGTRARAAGVTMGYHNHEFEFAAAGGAMPMDRLLAETDPETVTFELDLYWAVHAGQDPLRYLQQQPHRFRLVHVKDSAGAPDHRQTAVGDGTIPFATMLPAAAQAGVQHFFVEMDNPTDAWASVEASYRNLAPMMAF